MLQIFLHHFHFPVKTLLILYKYHGELSVGKSESDSLSQAELSDNNRNSILSYR